MAKREFTESNALGDGSTDAICRNPRTGVPPLAVTRQGPCRYPWLRPNSRTPEVRSPVSLDNDPGPVSQLGKARERRVSRERRALSPNNRGSGPSVEPGPRGNPGSLMGSRTTYIVTGPLAKGRSRRPASGWSGADTCLQARHVYKAAWSPYKASPTTAFIVVGGRPH